ncbi:MAG: DUF2202 domain-containing protein [Chloroflexi bacterium]|nr:MAG: DUF2202 domain-containing protein [Chloroflexota bacterium]
MKNILIVGLLIAVVGTAFGSVMPVSAKAMSVSGAYLSASEQDDLIFMREEEKLAHDVYVTLYSTWGLPVFQNIANREATHTAAVKLLLDRYGIADPTAGKGFGEFTNPDLQKLYDQLVAQGSKSLVDALKVGAAIEEIDILDLQTRIARTTNADIKLVYNNLLRGSENHLRAFTSTLQKQTGETYAPQYLDATIYNSIVGTSNPRGGWRRGNR